MMPLYQDVQYVQRIAQRRRERRVKLMAHATADATRQITVVRPGALGDTLLTLPALALLRRWAPDAHLTLIARADILPLALASGLADHTWPWDLPDWGVLFASQADTLPLTPRAQAALVQADVVIVWAPDPSGVVAGSLSALGAGQVIVAPAQPPPTDMEGDEQVHTAVWLAETLRPLGVAPESPMSLAALTRITPRLQPPAADIAQADALWRELRLPARVVALHPGSGSQRKRWPAERFAEVARLARDAGYHPLLLAGEADAQALSETQGALARLGLGQVSLALGLRVATLAALFARCVGYVGCDAGVSHLAGLVGAPTVAVFGPTDPARWSPLGPRVCAVRAPDAQLDHLSADVVWAALRSLLPASAAN
jgi:heptosyltransferase-3